MHTQRENGNGKTPTPARLHLMAPSATPDEAAAVVAALEQFLRATAPPAAPPRQPANPWQRAAILEGVERESQTGVSDPWINT
jgi:hypothetical protein